MAGRIKPSHLRAKAATTALTIDTASLWSEPIVWDVWCDASVTDPTGMQWAGFGVVYRHRGTWRGFAQAVGSGLAPAKAEMHAVLVTMRLACSIKQAHGATSEDFDMVKIRTDCQEVVDKIELWQTQPGPHPEECREFVEELANLEEAGISFECVKCASHQNRGLPNDHADRLAKKGSSAALSHASGGCNCGSQVPDACRWSDHEWGLDVTEEYKQPSNLSSHSPFFP